MIVFSNFEEGKIHFNHPISLSVSMLVLTYTWQCSCEISGSRYHILHTRKLDQNFSDFPWDILP